MTDPIRLADLCHESLEVGAAPLVRLFLDRLDPSLYRTDFATEGSSNYAFTLILQRPDPDLCRRVMTPLRAHGVEFRRGTAGGGNQVRQPYLRKRLGDQPMPGLPDKVVRLLHAAFEELTGADLASDPADHVYRQEYAHGGMSSGMISLDTWRQELMPALVQRANTLLSV